MNKTKKGVLLLILILIIGSILLVLVSKIKNGVIANEKGLKENLPTTFDLSKDDSTLLKETSWDKIKIIRIRNSKFRAPIPQLLIDDKYLLYIFTIDTIGKLSFRDSLLVEQRDVDRTTGISYHIFDYDYFYKVQFKSGITSSTSSVYLTIAGDSIESSARNDTIIGYSLMAKNISLRYGKNEPINIYIVGNDHKLDAYKIPLSLVLKKKKGKTFLLVMTTSQPGMNLPKDLILSIID